MESKLVDLESLADHLGVSVLSAKLMLAAGMPGGEHYRPFADSVEGVAEYFGINRRTAYEWKQKGMPGKKGCFDLDAIAEWRMQLCDAPSSVLLKTKGKLFRSIFRVLALEVRIAIVEALADSPNCKEKLALAGEIRKRLDAIFPSEREINRAIEEMQILRCP